MGDVNWSEVGAFLGAVVVVVGAFGGLAGWWIRSQIREGRYQAERTIRDYVDTTCMSAGVLEERFDDIRRRLGRLESPPVADKLARVGGELAMVRRLLEELEPNQATRLAAALRLERQANGDPER